MIRTAVTGLTTAGYEHARAYRADTVSELCGVCDGDEGRARGLGRQLGVPSFTRFEDLIEAAKPDLLSVMTPLAEGSRVVRAALEAGVNVLAGVPFASDVRETRELLRMARERDLILAADFHLRFSPAVAKARQWLDAGLVGRPLFVNMNLWTRGEEGTDAHALLRDLAAHGIDTMRRFCGEVRRVQCFGVNARELRASAVWSSVQVNMEFEDGTVANLTTSHDMSPRHPMARVEVAGTKARFVIDNVYEEATLYVHTEEEKRVITNSIFGGIPQLRDTYGRRVHRLLEQMSDGTPPERIDGGAGDALAAAAVVEAAIRALEEKSVVEVSR